jgi:glycine oxidase
MTGSGPGALVIGAGVIGCAVAYHLARCGLRIEVLAPDPGPSSTTRASLGVLTHFNGGDNPLSRLYRDGLASFPALAHELRAETGVAIGWEETGGLDLVLDDEDEVEAREALRYNLERGCPAEWVEGPALADLEPTVSGTARAAVYYPGDQRVDPVRLRQGLLRGAELHGATLRTGELEGFAESTDRGVVVQTRPDRLSADFVVLAAGAWTGRLAGLLGARVPVRPVRGQQARFVAERPIQRVLRQGGHHLVPDGEAIAVGATVEEVEFDEGVTPEAVAAFSSRFEKVLGVRPVPPEPLEQRAGLRPKPKGARPLIGPLTDHPRVFVATGHYKNGILMGPATGELVAEWIASGRPGRDLSYFAPER